MYNYLLVRKQIKYDDDHATIFHHIFVMCIPQHSNSYLPHQEEEAIEDEEDEKEITQWEAICWLFILTIWISVLSGYLVDAIQVLKILLIIKFLCTLFCPFSQSIAYSSC